MSRLLSITHFNHVFLPFKGKRIGHVRMPGNVGDKLIEQTTFDLVKEFDLDFYIEDLSGKPKADELAISGGGCMGKFWKTSRAVRVKALETGLPITVLPQSFVQAENDAYYRVYVREMGSLELRPDAALAPDLALAAKKKHYFGGTKNGHGIWLRQDHHGLFKDVPSLGDPITACEDVDQYLGLAASFERIETDRLHFAIAGLITHRHVTLLPIRYHKNRSIYEIWLKDLGCHWADEP